MEIDKYRIMFVAICLFIGFAIYLNSGKPTEDLDPKVLKMENIKKVEIKRVSDDKVTILNNDDTKQLIKDLLNSKKTKIIDPRSSRTDFYIKVFLIENKTVLIKFMESKKEGKFISANSFKYKNDSLYNKLFQTLF